MAETSIDKVKAEIRDLKTEVESEIDVTNEVKYTDEEIERLLRKLPVVMFQAAQTIVLRLMDFKEAKRKQKKVLALQIMKANARKELTSATDRKAWAENTKDFEKAEIEVINAEAQYKIAEYRFEMLDNLYMGVKKLIIMRTAQNDAEERYSRSNYNRGSNQRPPR